MTAASGPPPGRYLLVTFMVTEEGEQGHPMNHVLTRVDIGEDGQPDTGSIQRLTARIRDHIQNKISKG